MSGSTARLWLVTNYDRCGLAGVVGLRVWVASGMDCAVSLNQKCNMDALTYINAFQGVGPDMLIRCTVGRDSGRGANLQPGDISGRLNIASHKFTSCDTRSRSVGASSSAALLTKLGHMRYQLVNKTP